jgi:hypothetical protein
MGVTATVMVTCYLWRMAKISFLSSWISCITRGSQAGEVCVVYVSPPKKKCVSHTSGDTHYLQAWSVPVYIRMWPSIGSWDFPQGLGSKPKANADGAWPCNSASLFRPLSQHTLLNHCAEQPPLVLVTPPVWLANRHWIGIMAPGVQGPPPPPCFVHMDIPLLGFISLLQVWGKFGTTRFCANKHNGVSGIAGAYCPHVVVSTHGTFFLPTASPAVLTTSSCIPCI